MLHSFHVSYLHACLSVHFCTQSYCISLLLLVGSTSRDKYAIGESSRSLCMFFSLSIQFVDPVVLCSYCFPVGGKEFPCGCQWIRQVFYKQAVPLTFRTGTKLLFI